MVLNEQYTSKFVEEFATTVGLSTPGPLKDFKNFFNYVFGKAFDFSDQGRLKHKVQFASALILAVNIVYAEFNNLIEISRSHDLIHNFAE